MASDFLYDDGAKPRVHTGGQRLKRNRPAEPGAPGPAPEPRAQGSGPGPRARGPRPGPGARARGPRPRARARGPGPGPGARGPGPGPEPGARGYVINRDGVGLPGVWSWVINLHQYITLMGLDINVTKDFFNRYTIPFFSRGRGQ